MREAGKKLLPTKRVQRLGDATARLKVMTPFFQLVDMRDHMRKLLASYAALSATKHDDKLEVVTGTHIREAPAEYLTARRSFLRMATSITQSKSAPLCKPLRRSGFAWKNVGRPRQKQLRGRAWPQRGSATHMHRNSWAPSHHVSPHLH